MAIGDDYCTLTELKSYMGNEITAADSELEDAIESASREIERFTKRQFNKETTATARRYYPLDRENVFVDDFHTTTGLVVEYLDPNDHHAWIELEDHDYELYPIDGIMSGMPGWPFWHIMATDDIAFPIQKGRPTIRVTAQWGWDSVPRPVHQAALELSHSTYGLRHARLGVAGSDQFGTVIRVGDNRMAYNKLARYKRTSVQCM